MVLLDLLKREKAALHDAWLSKTLETYPRDARSFFKRENNKFANPVGQTLSAELSALLDCLLYECETDSLCRHLEELMKIRSVQQFTPSRAVVFILMLKDAVKEIFTAELKDPEMMNEFVSFEREIDQVALFAFDLYVKTREKMYQLRVAEVKRQVSTLMKRSDYFVGGSGFDGDRQ